MPIEITEETVYESIYEKGIDVYVICVIIIKKVITVINISF